MTVEGQNLGLKHLDLSDSRISQHLLSPARIPSRYWAQSPK